MVAGIVISIALAAIIAIVVIATDRKEQYRNRNSKD